jgi:hypothetical protein
MRRSAGIMILVLAMLWAASCSRVVRQVDTGPGSRGVFTEVTRDGAGRGTVDLIVKLSIKTHLPDHYVLESSKALHGKPGYPFVFTIDGQTVVWRDNGELENTPTYDAKGIRMPEGGEGRRYTLNRRLRLAPGSHLVEVDLPEEDYRCAFRVNLAERAAAYSLELAPVYGRGGKNRPTFLYGVTRIDPYLDSEPVRLEKS